MNVFVQPIAALVQLSTGLTISEDQLLFLFALYISLAASYLYKHKIKESDISLNLKCTYLSLVGLWIVCTIWGWYSLFAIIEVGICYILMVTLSPKVSNRYIFIVAMTFLSIAHGCNLYDRMMSTKKDYSNDFTGPIMIITQRLTSLSFSLSDGLTKVQSTLTPDQRKYALRRIPTFYEYCAYMFSFLGIMVGPLVFYNDFIKCTHQRENDKNNTQAPPVTKGTVSRKIACSMIMITAYWLGTKLVPGQRNVDPYFIENTSLLKRFLYLYISLFVARAKFYGVWIFADAVHNVAGIGFSGYRDDGSPSWDLISNINIYNIEFATGMKFYIDNWNIMTVKWIRHVAYDRLNTKHRTFASFLLSAFWHGFFPGYYMMFLTCHLFLLVQRKVRRIIRPLFQSSASLRMLYEVVTFFITQSVIAYSVLPFVVLDWSAFIRFYKSVGFVGHIIGIVLFICVPNQKQKVPLEKVIDGQDSLINNGKLPEKRKTLADNLARNGHNTIRHR